MNVNHHTILFLLVFAVACDQPSTVGNDPLGLGSKEATTQMIQRSTKTVPGVMGRISLKIGDVETGDQVEFVSIIDHKDESEVVNKRRISKGAIVSFKIDNTPYDLQLTETDPTHLINDTATFVVRAAN